uniref:hypothetical protein n=1 Tax=Bacillus licheniformis TaxID=1402 RepID=UPI001867FBAC|nr:hypothetical protein [Bacillus licheniformis]
MKFDINKQFIVLKVDEKSTVNLYTLIDSETGDKVVSIGVKETELKNRDLADVTLSIRTQNEKFDTKDGVKYVEVLNTFVSKISKVKA